MLGGVLASFLFRNTKPSIDLLVEAVSVYNIAAEFAEQAPHVNGPGTFLSELLDQLYQMNDITYKIKSKGRDMNMMFDSKQLSVYFICGTQDIPKNKSIEQVLKEALEAGITLYQFREKVRMH